MYIKDIQLTYDKDKKQYCASAVVEFTPFQCEVSQENIIKYADELEIKVKKMEAAVNLTNEDSQHFYECLRISESIRKLENNIYDKEVFKELFKESLTKIKEAAQYPY